MARSALCPIIGFNGSFCPGEQWEVEINDTLANSSVTLETELQRQRRESPNVVLRLPQVVGMAIDISTGDILLPALELTDNGSKQWTDVESGQIFYIPNEVEITKASDNDNGVSVRIFNTENELVDTWLRGYEEGGWSGGQFARTKNISHVFDLYFKDNQATSISQNLKVVYTVAVPDTKLKLNRYAQQAINQLTSRYDETLYNSFLDVWGTHITVSNKVGGMTEQQVQFKKCLLDATDFTDSMSLSSLEMNLKQDLVAERPCIQHYYWQRRRKLVDHRIGGDVLMINDAVKWEQTIVFAPALLSIVKYIPWYNLIQNGTIKNNLERAIKTRVQQMTLARQQEAEQIRVTRANMQLEAKVIYGYFINGIMNYIVNDDTIILNGSDQCRAGIVSDSDLLKMCNVGSHKLGACSIAVVHRDGKNVVEITSEVPLAYERNHTTGSFRIVARRQIGYILNNIIGDQNGIQFENYDVEGDWVHSGCSIIDNRCITQSTALKTVADIKKVYLCSGCTMQCNGQTSCNCICPIYERDPQTDPFRPYCNKYTEKK
ncbi:unnamed protein product [Rotaria sp. Silwood1]|nr:unnamed protein product [Rotaria sp. Silwood1]